MKDYTPAELLDTYGALLTERQRDVLAQYYFCDHSLTEISANLSITRQAVHSALRMGVKSLYNYESAVLAVSDKKKLIKIMENIKTEALPKDCAAQILEALEILRG